MSFNNLDQLYRQVIMDHYKNPRNRGQLDSSESVTIDMNNPTCGDRIQLQLQVENGQIKNARFTGEGCSISMSSASMMTEAIKGKTLDEALKMSQLFSDMMLGKDIDSEEVELGDIEALQGVAKFPARIKCATLAWKAMEKGINQENKS
ncbi:MAG TPA: SUF system NifU family Fe-S cluster assembly protein [Candidatus Angelobacter sp.]|nr:SUF system NifU family Fe-S cluster assembly protein [Candidatus Angelobacter sp.]